jgi:hypothetical protein
MLMMHILAGWNPQVENQAIDRVYRVGQTRPVEIRRIVIKNAVEQRILEMQERKMKILQVSHHITLLVSTLANLMRGFCCCDLHSRMR